MRKLLFIFIIFSSLSISAQQRPAEVGWIAKFGAAGGFSPLVLFPDFAELNKELGPLQLENLDGPIFAPGGGGYVYVMFIDNLRLGGMGFGGSKTRSNSINGINTELEYSIGGGAVTIEYTLPFIKKLAVSVGTMIGGGVLEINLNQNNGSFEWNNLLTDFKDNNSIQNKSFTFDNSFLMITPIINCDFPISRFMAIRLGTGYQFAIGKKWEIANSQTLQNVSSGINGNSFFIQTGLYFGFFAF